ncbi:hypothetical protein J2M53_11755 [Arthrobacter sp. zg-ZUI100]|uniref:hypothetical protein n=1 Tax=Arthrobacter jiangjiafuii TaxID=2817475 RepID=UPI001AED58E8|nr:hypothetical protein [Arthrobacter jiangjiafuii]MBP3036920.1 hypothetical protein [Arthrobacter jiangjiafuii]
MRAYETDHAEPRESMDSPNYRVNFWVKPRPGYGWNLDAYVLTEAGDITEVLRWVEEHADGRRFEVFAEIDEEPVLPLGTPGPVGWFGCWEAIQILVYPERYLSKSD